jgi:hypothetical protein
VTQADLGLNQSAAGAAIIFFMSHIAKELIIEAGRTERNYWRDLFGYRELFYFRRVARRSVVPSRRD